MNEEILIAVLAAIIVFLVFREFFCWYWKQNKIVGLLREIAEKLDRIATKEPTSERPPAPVKRVRIGPAR